jgi:hypothetical protein
MLYNEEHSRNLDGDTSRGTNVGHDSILRPVKVHFLFFLSLRHQNNGLENITMFHLLLFNSGAIKSILRQKKILKGHKPSHILHLQSYAYDRHYYLEIIHNFVFSNKTFRILYMIPP